MFGSSFREFILAKPNSLGSLNRVQTYTYIPDSPLAAGRQMRLALASPLEQMPKPDFVRAWCSLAYLFPGLHPDGFEDADSGWPRTLKSFAAEAWRRNEIGELADEELYPCDAQWAGLYDRMTLHTPDETARRTALVVSSGQAANA